MAQNPIFVPRGSYGDTRSETNYTGVLHIVDLHSFYQVATVVKVGIDPYGVAVVDRVDERDDD